MRIKVKKKNIHLKAIMMINPVTLWFEIAQYDDKREIYIVNLVETTWLSRYPRPIKITYDQGAEFIGREFRKILIEIEYGINPKPSTSENPMSNAILEHINMVQVDLVWTYNISQTYIDKYNPWSGILCSGVYDSLNNQ